MDQDDPEGDQEEQSFEKSLALLESFEKLSPWSVAINRVACKENAQAYTISYKLVGAFAFRATKRGTQGLLAKLQVDAQTFPLLPIRPFPIASIQGH